MTENIYEKESMFKMKVLIGTGNAVLDQYLQKYMANSEKVNYLEEINEVIGRVTKVDVIVLSSFLPSVHDDTEQQKNDAFNDTIKLTLEKGVRIIFLTDMTFPLQDLRILFDLEIYDFIVSEDGDVDLGDILQKIKVPTSKENAAMLIEKFAEKQAPSAQHGKLRLADKADFYQRLDYKDVERGQAVSQQPLYDGPPITQFKSDHQVTSQKPFYEEDVLTRLSPTGFSSMKPNRQKSLEKNSENFAEEAKTFAFWGASTNLGKRTLSQTYAMQIAKLGYSVLYVELDYLNPTLALTTALTNPDKNFYQLSLSQDSFDLDSFVANKMDVRITKEMVQLFNEIPNDFHFLGLPSGFEKELFPSITNEGFLSTLISALKEVNFDAIVINLPNEVENLFSFPVMLESDVVFAVTTANPVRINEYREMNKLLVDTPLDMNKWEVIVNQVGSEISKDVCDQLLREHSIITVPHDTQRPLYELDLRFGSPIINQKMAELASLYGFLPPEPIESKRKSFFKKK